MPLVLGVMLSRQSTDDRSRIVIAAPAMAMMILGGDPQMALHSMIVVGVFYLVQCCRRVETELTLKSVIAVPIIAAMLSAPQLAASLSWSRQSDRVTADESSVWYAPPVAESKRAESFQFSLAPWHVAELVTPSPFGSLFPIYRRISHLIVGDGRMWTPTIYMGMITLVGLVIGLGNRQLRLTDRWTAVAILCLWLSMGHFGLVMVIQAATGLLPDVDSAIGGPYWVLYQLIPGYDSFRYPAKWLPLFSLGAAIATAGVMDTYQWKRLDWRWFAFAGLFFVMLLATVTAMRINSTWITDQAGRARRDEFWGPMDVRGGLAQIQWSIVHSALAMFAILSLTLVRLPSQTKMFALLIIVCVDLGIASDGLLATVPSAREQALFNERSPETLLAGSRWMRTQSSDGCPDVWKQTASDDRMLEVETSLRASRFGRWHLADRIGMLNNMVSIQSQNMAEFWQAAGNLTASMSVAQQEEFWKAISGWLSIDGVIHLSATAVEVAEGDRTFFLMDSRLSWSPPTKQLRYTPGATEKSVAVQNKQEFASRLDEIAVRSENNLISSASTISDESSIYSGVKIDSAGVVMRPVFQDGHWIAAYSPSGANEWKPVPVLQIDRLVQGVVLPAGNWDLRFDYKPIWLVPSLVIAGLTWMGLVFWSRGQDQGF